MHETSKRSLPPGTLLQENRGRWTAGKATWNAFAGIPCQVDGKKRHLEHFRGNSVPGGRQEKLPGTLSQEFRARWKAGKATWNTFAGIPCQVEGRKSYLEHFRRKTVPGGRQEETPGTLSQENRGRGTAGKATWNAFAGIPCQVDGKKRHLERFCGKTVAGGRREETLGTLSQENRGRWTARRDTWNTFAGKPCQVEGGKEHLERVCGISVPGGWQEKPPGTLLRGFRARWMAGKATWNAFAGIPCQVDGRK